MENLNLTPAKPGTKSVKATRPELAVTPTFNQFSLNGLATDKMDLEHGETVTIHENDSEDFANRFYISKGVGKFASKVASATKTGGTGKTLTFNYAGVYSRMLQQDPTAPVASAETLAEKGLIQTRTTKKGNTSYTGLYRIYFGVGDGVEAEVEGETVTVYPLIEPDIEPFEPRGNATNVAQDMTEEEA